MYTGKLFYLRGPKDIEPEQVCDIMLSNFRESRDGGGAGRRWVFELNSPGRTQYMLQADGAEVGNIYIYIIIEACTDPFLSPTSRAYRRG
jgi:hypothetical protein